MTDYAVIVVGAGLSGAVMAGRLADYKYYNTDDAIANALATFAQLGNLDNK